MKHAGLELSNSDRSLRVVHEDSVGARVIAEPGYKTSRSDKEGGRGIVRYYIDYSIEFSVSVGGLRGAY